MRKKLSRQRAFILESFIVSGKRCTACSQMAPVGRKVKAYFVDSISFRELPDFLQLEPELNQEELAYRIEDQYLAIQVATEGYDYSFYDKEYKLMDGGILDNPDISIREAVQDILEDEGLEQLERIPVDYDELQEKAEEVEAEILQEARSQRKRVPVISEHTEA